MSCLSGLRPPPSASDDALAAVVRALKAEGMI
jgi:hypothetical protein